MTRRICVVMDAHLSSCPRMLKAADSLAEAGYAVRVVSTRTTTWATTLDDDVVRRRRRPWEWHVVDESRNARPFRWAVSGIRMRAARRIASVVSPAKTPVAVVATAQCRAFHGLVEAASREPVDLVYGGTGRGLAAARVAAMRLGVPYALDLEDFHSAEGHDSADARLSNALAARIEREVLRDAVFVTAGSAEIAYAYERAYGVAVSPVHNTFPLPPRPPSFDCDARRLRLYWFSQTIGPGRGLEEAIVAAGLAGIDASLTLRGNASEAYLRSLRELAKATAPNLELRDERPGPPDDMIDLARGYDVGLALEHTTPRNRDLCLTNKAFTYMLAGLAIAFTNTAGQRRLAADVGEAAFAFDSGDVNAFARGLRLWATDGPRLVRAREAAWAAARRRWHWEHESERGVLLREVARVLSADGPRPLTSTLSGGHFVGVPC